MIPRNLRHLRLFADVAQTRSLTITSARWNVTQPAVTQALDKLERGASGRLFERGRQGLFPTPRGTILLGRVVTALALLDEALRDVSPRLRLTLTHAQLRALIAVSECENFALAARALGLAQPTVHRAVSHAEKEAGRSLFERTPSGSRPTRSCADLAQAGRLALYELEQADTELAELDGGEAGSISIGAMPLARSVLLPQALTAFRRQRPRFPVRVVDGPYDALLAGLRRGEIDFLAGALRDPAPIDDVVQQRLFDDRLALLAGPGHPLARRGATEIGELSGFPWVVPRQGTPTRRQFELLFSAAGAEAPDRVIESGSLLMMREILRDGLHLGCISRHQAQPECDHGLLVQLGVATDHLVRPIGLTFRRNWRPTPPQRLLLDLIEAAVPCEPAAISSEAPPS
jgi:DNA-binding transcriptional LysR family regulator